MKYSVKAAAIATGVSESRLRTWERRYGIPRPGRSDSGRRQYTEEDLTVIRRMAALVDAGVPASEAAVAVRTEGPIVEQEAMPAEHPLALQLVAFCRTYDDASALKTIRSAVDDLGWEAAIDSVLLPALKNIGAGWREDDLVTANEHFATELIRREIACASPTAADMRAARRSVMLACPEDERHEIGLLSLGLLLKQKGIGVYYIGADVPAADLLSAVRATKVNALVLAATLPSSLASLERTARTFVSGASVKLYVGGPAFYSELDSTGVPGIRLPRRVQDAAKLIVDSLDGGEEVAQ